MTKSLIVLREAIARLLVVFLAFLVTCLIKGDPISLHYMGLLMIFIPTFIFSLSMTRKKKCLNLGLVFVAVYGLGKLVEALTGQFYWSAVTSLPVLVGIVAVLFLIWLLLKKAYPTKVPEKNQQ
ncbi:UNVERIFIED_CONTAM: cell division protein FtsW [Streptococcus canis]|uniref:Cell division protein FtsW n=1 Tax=Streptococcus canis TaxID=1329 RepID=A0AAE4Q716_STRCB|nr:cell division protein FtsW [Streptococcus canis]MDV5976497.1 cell division protein FtsW [Streptococcus canis]